MCIELKYGTDIPMKQKYLLPRMGMMTEKSKRRDVYIVDVNIPTNLVFGIAIPTSSFNFVQLFFMPVLSKFRYLVQQDLYFMLISDPQALIVTPTLYSGCYSLGPSGL
jgi:hypothetical protein